MLLWAQATRRSCSIMWVDNIGIGSAKDGCFQDISAQLGNSWKLHRLPYSATWFLKQLSSVPQAASTSKWQFHNLGTPQSVYPFLVQTLHCLLSLFIMRLETEAFEA